MAELKRLRDILKDIREGMSYREIGIKYKKSSITIARYVQILRKLGFTVDVKTGRKRLKI